MEFIFRIIGFVITLGILYLIGAFIAMDSNPLNWWWFKTSAGRFVGVIIFIFVIVANFVEDFDNVKK